MNNENKFIKQEQRVIESLSNRIKEIKRRAKEDILNCEIRIKEAKSNIKLSKNK